MTDNDKLCTLEAEAAVREVKFGVKDISLALDLPSKAGIAYFNLTTLEEESMCIEVTPSGFRVVGSSWDSIVEEKGAGPPPNSDYFETVYSLLNAKSEKFREKFSESLSTRLLQLEASDDTFET